MRCLGRWARLDWVNSLGSRLPVQKLTTVAIQTTLTSMDRLGVQLAAVKQELSEFRGEMRKWKRENGFSAPARQRDDTK